jgi:hypothetical protein
LSIPSSRGSDLVEGELRLGALLDHLDEMEAEAGLDDAGELAGGELERRLLERRHHLAAVEPAEIAPAFARTLVVRASRAMVAKSPPAAMLGADLLEPLAARRLLRRRTSSPARIRMWRACTRSGSTMRSGFSS